MKSIISVSLLLWLVSCGGELREKPQLDCTSDAVACSDGIIGSCAGGTPQYSVCSDIAVCQAGWQQAGAYKCSKDNAPSDAGVQMYVLGRSDTYLQGGAMRVIGDSNADGILSPGEAGTLSIELRNAGDTTARDITATLSTSHSGVTITSGSELYFGDIAPSGSACGSSSPDLAGECSNFSVLAKIALGANVSLTRIKFDLTVSDAAAISSMLSFELDLGASDPL